MITPATRGGVLAVVWFVRISSFLAGLGAGWIIWGR